MSCTYYRWNGGLFGGDYWCDKKDVRVDENTYSKYCRNYDYGDCPIYKHQESSGCFITTVIHQVLGHSDSCQVLNDFRLFRDQVLQVTPKYYEGLKEYDSIGPIVACHLSHDKDAKDMAEMTYQLDLLKVHKFYLEGKYDEAYQWYCKMTRDLISYYGLDNVYEELRLNNFGYDDFDPKMAGHGRIKKKLCLEANFNASKNI